MLTQRTAHAADSFLLNRNLSTDAVWVITVPIRLWNRQQPIVRALRALVCGESATLEVSTNSKDSLPLEPVTPEGVLVFSSGTTAVSFS